MISPNVDLGQLFLGALIATVGYLLKRTIENIGTRVDKHDEMLIEIKEDVSYLSGKLGRRSYDKAHS